MDTEAYSKELGLRLRAARMRNGMSLQDVEARTNGRFDAGTVRTYEVAERKIPVEKFLDLAGLYGEAPAALAPEIPGLERPLIVCSQCGTPHLAGFASAVLARW